eukprot:m.1631068 g.1631068  ORF g.1631068 m.1631068 type:complete len:72 (-) comp25401_c2_seq2:93-308(-)
MRCFECVLRTSTAAQDLCSNYEVLKNGSSSIDFRFGPYSRFVAMSWLVSDVHSRLLSVGPGGKVSTCDLVL